MKLVFLALLFIASNGNAQDTLRYDVPFKLPVKLNRPGYDTSFSQQAIEVRSFSFQVPDSCEVNIVIRSKSDGLKIVTDDGTVIRKREKDQEIYVYSTRLIMPAGARKFFIRTGDLCRYTVNVSGLLLYE